MKRGQVHKLVWLLRVRLCFPLSRTVPVLYRSAIFSPITAAIALGGPRLLGCLFHLTKCLGMADEPYSRWVTEQGVVLVYRPREMAVLILLGRIWEHDYPLVDLSIVMLVYQRVSMMMNHWILGCPIFRPTHLGAFPFSISSPRPFSRGSATI